MKYAIVTKNDDYSKSYGEIIKRRINIEYDEKDPDIVISVGGDGTILNSLHKYEKICDKITIFGINTGHLGFITNFTIEEIDKVAEMINTGNFIKEQVGLIDYKITTALEVIKGKALNEVTVINPPRTLIVDVLLDNEDFERFRGTGLCVSTPFGSTGYNKSLHGCVVDPKIECIQLTEIASINSKAYRTLASPLILSSDKEVTIKNNDSLDTWVTVDNISYRLSNFKTMQCRYSKHHVSLARNDIEFIDRLKKAFITN